MLIPKPFERLRYKDLETEADQTNSILELTEVPELGLEEAKSDIERLVQESRRKIGMMMIFSNYDPVEPSRKLLETVGELTGRILEEKVSKSIRKSRKLSPLSLVERREIGYLPITLEMGWNDKRLLYSSILASFLAVIGAGAAAADILWMAKLLGGISVAIPLAQVDTTAKRYNIEKKGYDKVASTLTKKFRRRVAGLTQEPDQLSMREYADQMLNVGIPYLETRLAVFQTMVSENMLAKWLELKEHVDKVIGLGDAAHHLESLSQNPTKQMLEALQAFYKLLDSIRTQIDNLRQSASSLKLDSDRLALIGDEHGVETGESEQEGKMVALAELKRDFRALMDIAGTLGNDAEAFCSGHYLAAEDVSRTDGTREGTSQAASAASRQSTKIGNNQS